MLIAQLDEQLEWLLLVNAAKVPDLCHKIDAVNESVFEAVGEELCRPGAAEAALQSGVCAAAVRNLVDSDSPAAAADQRASCSTSLACGSLRGARAALPRRLLAEEMSA